ncbi:MAG: VIT1/CCC1 transporter family protein [candidate division WWE3 bacterium]|nr:VIT1/CCC1 transporter family protein [candidate division WWE3 bacterium]
MKRHLELHSRVSVMRDVILGGQDGLVNVLGIVLGVSAASTDNKILVAAAMSAAFAEAVSMAAVAYTSTMAEKDHFDKEEAREKLEVETKPQDEIKEIRDIYVAKGFNGQLLEDVVTHITSDKTRWVNIMMKEELGITRVNTTTVLWTAATVGIAALIASFIPVFPFFLTTGIKAVAISLTVSAISLFAIGAYEAKTYVGSWKRSGVQLMIIGMGAATVGFLIGKIFHVN